MSLWRNATRTGLYTSTVLSTRFRGLWPPALGKCRATKSPSSREAKHSGANGRPTGPRRASTRFSTGRPGRWASQRLYAFTANITAPWPMSASTSENRSAAAKSAGAGTTPAGRWKRPPWSWSTWASKSSRLTRKCTALRYPKRGYSSAFCAEILGVPS